jgi:hypothetical protein
MSDCCLTPYHGENRLIVNEMSDFTYLHAIVFVEQIPEAEASSSISEVNHFFFFFVAVVT